MLPLLYSKKITLPRLDRLVNQACTLERSVKRSGRDEITHPTHGHDDLINAVAGAAAVAMRAALVEQRVPIVMPFVAPSMFAPPPGGWSIFDGGPPPPGSGPLDW